MYIYLFTWRFIPLIERVITQVISGTRSANQLMPGVITVLPSGMNHQLSIYEFTDLNSGCWDSFLYSPTKVASFKTTSHWFLSFMTMARLINIEKLGGLNHQNTGAQQMETIEHRFIGISTHMGIRTRWISCSN